MVLKKNKQEVRKKKFALWVRLWEALDKYNKCIVVKCDNITAAAFQNIRQALRPLGATIMMGKNTLVKAGIKRKMEKPKQGDEDYEIRHANYHEMPQLDKLINLCANYVGLIFCRDNLSEVKEKLKDYKCCKGARIGAIAPSDVTIPPGPTGLDPKQTAYFQALNIQTKISKAQIEIINPVKILTKGQKIGASECALLDKLNIKPFVFELEAQHVYDNGTVYSPSVLDIKKEEILEKFRKGAAYLTAASLQSGYPTTLAVKQMMLSGFKNLVAVSMSTPFEFKEAKAIKSAATAAPAEKPKKEAEKTKEAPKKAEEKKVEEKKEEEVVGGLGGMFGDDM